MVEFVALDAAQADRGTHIFNVGVLLEIEGGSEFDDHYFSRMEEICEEYDINSSFKVMKSNEALKQLPSYHIPEARNKIVKSILTNPAIRHIHINIGYYRDSISPPWYDGSKSGIEFATGWMAQLFEIITLWRYSQDRYTSRQPDDAWIDDVSGRICRCWSYVNNDFDLSIAPHGDSTYPSLASADFLAGYLAKTLPVDRDLNELPDAAFGLLKGMGEDEGVDLDIWASPVDSEYEDEIVPHHPYQIGGNLHYPHPVLFVWSDNFESSAGKVLTGTDFESHARKWAYENRGCYKLMQEHQFSNIVRSGDAIAYTTEDPPKSCKILRRLNSNKEIDLLSAEDLIGGV